MRLHLAACAILLLCLCETAHAACSCQCVDGQVEPLCESAIDLPPLCPPAICPITTPSIPPIMTPAIPPLGTSHCTQARVCDRAGNCQWQRVCE
jgi:hypothetical protein